MKLRKTLFTLLYLSLSILGIQLASAQQEPQYSQYQYNPMTINAGYTGSRGFPSLISLYRDQWVGIDGAPRTFSLGIDSPWRLFNGLGLSLISDGLGPAKETYFDLNYAHHLVLNSKGDRLALGLKGGIRNFSVDWSRGIHRDPDVLFNENINSRLLPIIGAGAFYYTDKSYVGLSTPNVLLGEHYNDIQEAIGQERIHIYFIAGYVFELSHNLKLKPSTFVKMVAGSPLIGDVSLNLLLSEKLNLGASYRWDDSISAMIGFNFSKQFDVGYAYDYPLTSLGNYNSGTHEIFLRFNMIPKTLKLKSPRFF